MSHTVHSVLSQSPRFVFLFSSIFSGGLTCRRMAWKFWMKTAWTHRCWPPSIYHPTAWDIWCQGSFRSSKWDFGKFGESTGVEFKMWNKNLSQMQGFWDDFFRMWKIQEVGKSESVRLQFGVWYGLWLRPKSPHSCIAFFGRGWPDDLEELQPFAVFGPLLQHLGLVRAWHVPLVEVFGR